MKKVSLMVVETMGCMDSVVHKVADFFCDSFGGVTCVPGYGKWKDDNGKVHSEKNVEVYTYTDDAEGIESVKDFAATLARDHNQDCVLVTVSEIVSVDFVSA